MLSTVRWSQIRHVKPSTTLQRGRRPISAFITPSHIGVHVRGSRGRHAALGGEQRSETWIIILWMRTPDGRIVQPTACLKNSQTSTRKQAKLSLNNVESRPSQTPEGHVNQVFGPFDFEGGFEGAQGAKRELLHAGALLGKSSIYVQAALHSLERRADTTHGQLFLEWWSLVPDEAMQQQISSVATTLMQAAYAVGFGDKSSHCVRKGRPCKRSWRSTPTSSSSGTWTRHQRCDSCNLFMTKRRGKACLLAHIS